MTALEVLQQARAFAPSVVFEDLAVVHVPFDQLTDSEAHEERVAKTARTDGMVLVIGRSGEGKSALTSWALNLDSGLLAIPVPVSVPHPHGASASLIPSLVLDGISNAITPLEERVKMDVIAAAAGQRTPRRVDASIDIKGLKVNIGDLLKTLPPGHRERLDAIRQADTEIRSQDLIPVLVLDDTDKWTGGRVAQGKAFFEECLSALAELRMPIVALAHPQYFDHARLPEHFDVWVGVPRLDPSGIRAILAQRITRVDKATSIEDVFAETAIERITQHYIDDEASIRRVIQLAGESLIEAVEAVEARITEGAVENALTTTWNSI
ncbi:MAG: hypothetical protein JJE52_14535 [Acidimicrobiia bacterium]|nr:hypothetical protein [Acidimicrobiia bacterium]